MKKISITLQNHFKEGEFVRLSREVVAAVRAAFLDVIVHADPKVGPNEVVCHAYGFDLDEGPKVEFAALEIVTSVWNTKPWRLGDQSKDATCGG